MAQIIQTNITGPYTDDNSGVTNTNDTVLTVEGRFVASWEPLNTILTPSDVMKIGGMLDKAVEEGERIACKKIRSALGVRD